MIYKGKIMAQGTPQELMEQTNTTNLREVFFALMKGEAE